ncbi:MULTISPECIES: efflux RND transporter periplasmic adaptor subunit [Sphingobacterium]|uniref:efflux RND transporter periplasmic adaptor subunit n=1 Tax=Sphingobacterium TaxID=28453 RepID=UPI00062A22F7|nr:MULTISPECIES: efflux RND transporter periplasmic adaptor subunit [Sphingobacterium]MCW2260595.1 cobalt-zinc-cadmium efflux system membrane fusion protein [Sphingobacterium kitahiroshimense]TCR08896.1 cobalt-zinc-cadmium efflux system membrane fusion protein [Sphingobacterium sp. JUb78]
MKTTITKKHSHLIRILIISVLSLSLMGCHTKVDEEITEDFTQKGDTIQVQGKVKSQLKTYTVLKQAHQLELITAGTVKAIPNLYAEIGSPFSGRVSAVHLKLGMKTKSGTPLYELISPEFIDTQKLYFQAKTAYQNARLILKRQQDLKQHGVGTDKDVEEARAQYEITEKEYQNTSASLRFFNVDTEKLVLGQPLIIRSPIGGEVISNDIVLGQYIKSDDLPLAKVAELNTVWVVGMVKEQNLNLINKLDLAEIATIAFPDDKIKGTIYHIDEIVNEDTRSIQILIECRNPDRLLKPGMYVNVNFTKKASDAVFIPAKSLLQYNDQSYVFLAIGKDKYLRRYVETGITDKDQVQILSGLQAGDNIISEGAFYLLNAK